MSTSTKTLKTYLTAGTSNGAGATSTGTALNHTTAYGGLITAKITNGATGPTVAATVNVYVSGDNSNWKLWASALSTLGNAIITEFTFFLPATAMYSRVDVTGNTVQAVTCEAFCQELSVV